MSRLANTTGRPILCCVTDRKSLTPAAGESQFGALLKQIVTAAVAGVDWIQIREKDASGREIFDLTRAALAKVSEAKGSAQHSTRIIVNDRLDVAVAAHAGGVHFGENSLSPSDVRGWMSLNCGRNFNQGFAVGVSCHSLESCKAAEVSGADYIFFGPTFATPSKSAFGAPQGLELLSSVCNTIKVPVLAIGGITDENAPSCSSAGAAGIAAIRLFQNPQTIAATVSAMRS